MKLTIQELYDILYDNLGPQGWWPADNPYEIIVGAILVQNTNWRNVERSLDNLRERTQFDPDKILALEVESLQTYIQPSGFFKNKSKAIISIFQWLKEHHYDFKSIDEMYVDELRNILLALPGIGPETADVLLVYVFDKVVFITDSYTRRLFKLLGHPKSESYHGLQDAVTLPESFTPIHAQEFHGLLDEFGKRYLSPKGVKSATFLDQYFVRDLDIN
ncbi:endonuclease III domain-containing protein [Macrococcus animalis]|uniref:endonuclease III domain-containing protein n=1 Tax=Macrococcus animalis TaxID=3395467 RepID=UPI0039BE526B